MIPQRKIIHCDADCFFAAIEIRDNPSLKGKPVAVGGSQDHRGVIATCNYEARQYGVRSAMPTRTALKHCPRLILLPHHFEKYREASRQMREIFLDYTALVEPLSLDEAYLDVSECQQHGGSASRIAEEIRQRIFETVRITVSAGVAQNKFLAKVASDWNKPNGLFVIPPEKQEGFLLNLPVHKIHGVGKVTTEKLHRMGVGTCGDLRIFTLPELESRFGSFGQVLFDLCRGIDKRHVVPTRIRKSLSVEHTYSNNIPDESQCLDRLPTLLEELSERLKKASDRIITKAFVKVKFSDFETTTLERAGTQPVLTDYQQLLSEALQRSCLPVRLLGIGVRFKDPEDNEAEPSQPQQTLLF